ncbi:MAG: serine--tRNA ligase, partial [Flavobacteriaceae bacterium]
MLQVVNIREHKEAYINALSKRGLDAQALLEEVLQLDEIRRNTQAQLDETLAQLNNASKEIGILYQKGEAEKANNMKAQTGEWKEQSKALQEQLNHATQKLDELLYTIPNIPS